MTAPSLYRVLGVRKTATDAQITKAYRKLAMKWHADRNPGDDAAKEKYAAVSTAYEVLSDPARRAHYDATGDTSAPRAHQALAELMSVLAPCLSAVLEAIAKQRLDAKRENVLKHMQTAMNKHRSNLLDVISDLMNTKVATEIAIERFSVKEGEENVVAGALKVQLQQIAARTQAVQNEKDRVQRALDYLKLCSYKTDGGGFQGWYGTAATSAANSVGASGFFRLGGGG